VTLAELAQRVAALEAQVMAQAAREADAVHLRQLMALPAAELAERYERHVAAIPRRTPRWRHGCGARPRLSCTAAAASGWRNDVIGHPLMSPGEKASLFAAGKIAIEANRLMAEGKAVDFSTACRMAMTGDPDLACAYAGDHRSYLRLQDRERSTPSASR
jgi:hypothetical protein